MNQQAPRPPALPSRTEIKRALRDPNGVYGYQSQLACQAADCLDALEGLLKVVQRELETTGQVSEETAHMIDLALPMEKPR